MTGQHTADEAAVDAVLAASRMLVGVAGRSLGPAAVDTTLAQYRALVVLAARGTQRMVDLAGALDVAPSTAGRMSDRLSRKGFISRHRGRSDRRAVLVSITPAGRQVLDDAIARRRALIADILCTVPANEQRVIGDAMRRFTDIAGEIPAYRWPASPANGSSAAREKTVAQRLSTRKDERS